MKRLLAVASFSALFITVLALRQAPLESGCLDSDGDGICNDEDNCRLSPNPGQADGDGDGQGDACDYCPADPDNDIDGDRICGDVDNCPRLWNPDQLQSPPPLAPCSPEEWTGPFIRGDTELDFFVTPKDALTILSWLYLGRPSLPCLAAADANADGKVDVSDPIWILVWLFMGGEPLPPPSECDISPNAGDITLGCERRDCQ